MNKKRVSKQRLTRPRKESMIFEGIDAFVQGFFSFFKFILPNITSCVVLKRIFCTYKTLGFDLSKHVEPM
jgi:hypothetical protein